MNKSFPWEKETIIEVITPHHAALRLVLKVWRKLHLSFLGTINGHQDNS